MHQFTLLCALATFFVGTIAGFQGLVARVPSEWSMALKTPYGLCYIVARGALPAVLYVVLHKFQMLNISNPLYEVLILGGGSETFLRSRILFAFKSAGPGQAQTEETKGPLDFIFWFQQFFIDRASNVLARQRLKAINRYYAKPDLKLNELVDGVQTNAGAVGKQAENAIKAANATHTDYLKANPTGHAALDARSERNWCKKLGYALYDALTIDNYEALSEEITK